MFSKVSPGEIFHQELARHYFKLSALEKILLFIVRRKAIYLRGNHSALGEETGEIIEKA
jgi:hypothetical protein